MEQDLNEDKESTVPDLGEGRSDGGHGRGKGLEMGANLVCLRSGRK